MQAILKGDADYLMIVGGILNVWTECHYVGFERTKQYQQHLHGKRQM